MSNDVSRATEPVESKLRQWGNRVGCEDEPQLDGMTLWCMVYDGPLYWGTNADGTGRSAFQYIRYLESLMKQLKRD